MIFVSFYNNKKSQSPGASEDVPLGAFLYYYDYNGKRLKMVPVIPTDGQW